MNRPRYQLVSRYDDDTRRYADLGTAFLALHQTDPTQWGPVALIAWGVLDSTTPTVLATLGRDGHITTTSAGDDDIAGTLAAAIATD